MFLVCTCMFGVSGFTVYFSVLSLSRPIFQCCRKIMISCYRQMRLPSCSRNWRILSILRRRLSSRICRIIVSWRWCVRRVGVRHRHPATAHHRRPLNNEPPKDIEGLSQTLVFCPPWCAKQWAVERGLLTTSQKALTSWMNVLCEVNKLYDRSLLLAFILIAAAYISNHGSFFPPLSCQFQ